MSCHPAPLLRDRGSACGSKTPAHATCMEPLISAAAPPWEGHGGWRARGRRPLSLLLLVAGASAFTGLAYRARDLAFLLFAYYLLALLVCCVAKLEQLRRRRDPAAGAELRRVKSAVSFFSVALANTFTYGVVCKTPAGMAVKLAAVGLALAVFALWLHLMFGSEDTESCDAEHGHGEEQRV
ncbi:hypothetical protein HU200_030974 [Digitaria exilis]|uniref:Uncharacterized protein n=1 Tax=Digitaria exilis TaxID=1010633 RepID=A0A835EMZ3_9POAL|nr:hypothetical protein HU200_030974 [Digitaria exilis]